MTDLVEFLEARITEDEHLARVITESGAWSPKRNELEWWVSSENFGHVVTTGYVGNSDSWPNAVHIARHDPARVLAECAAKRAIIAEHRCDDMGTADWCETCADWVNSEMGEGPPGVEWPCPTIKAIAAVYKDHPGYKEEWGS